MTHCRISPSLSSRLAAAGRGQAYPLERNAALDSYHPGLAVTVDRRRLGNIVELVEEVVREGAHIDLSEVDADAKIDEDIIVEVDRRCGQLLLATPLSADKHIARQEIGRASCRERVCQYV